MYSIMIYIYMYIDVSQLYTIGFDASRPCGSPFRWMGPQAAGDTQNGVIWSCHCHFEGHDEKDLESI